MRARHVLPKWRNIAALMIKTLVRMKRMPGYDAVNRGYLSLSISNQFITLYFLLCVGSSLCFQFLLPVIQVSLICLCVGGDPKGIQVAIVNNETSPSAFSQSFLSFLDNSSVQQVFVLALRDMNPLDSEFVDFSFVTVNLLVGCT